jgi:hypothetical protein
MAVRHAFRDPQFEVLPVRFVFGDLACMKATELEDLRIGQRVTMRYPNGILQQATLLGNDDGILNFQFGQFVRKSVGPVIDISVNGRGECSFGPRLPGRLN